MNAEVARQVLIGKFDANLVEEYLRTVTATFTDEPAYWALVGNETQLLEDFALFVEANPPAPAVEIAEAADGQ